MKAGIPVPLDAEERQAALISLMTTSLRAELEAANARLEATEKERTSANIALAELTICCQVPGIIGARYLEEGERVRLQDKILSLIDTASLYAIFPLREKDALRIEKGMSASVLLDGTGETKNGFVDLIYPQADSQSLSFLVRVLLRNTGTADNRLKPGMFARITVNLGPPRNAVFIPESSIFNQKNNEGCIFIVNGQSLTERKIIIAAVHGEECEISSGLNAGELVVLRPDPDLREAENVSVYE
jgi:RND family efflux transporter MFP subunit